MAAKFAVVVGARGVGKSSVLQALPKKYKLVNIGDVILEVCRSRGILKDRDRERRMDNATYNMVKERAYAKIASMGGNIILDTHATIEYNGRFVPGLPKYFMDKLDLVGLFYIDADIGTILDRRKKDRTRFREAEPRQLILDNRALSLAAFSYYSSRLNIPIYIIDNREGKLQESRRIFLAHLDDAFENDKEK